MDYYVNAQETENAAVSLQENGHYRQSVYLSCLAAELYLKSKLHLVPHSTNLETSHDLINIYKALTRRYKPKTDLMSAMVLFRKYFNESFRKYFNESRYPYAGDTNIYSKNFAAEFLKNLADIREYIDNQCLAEMKDLESRWE